VRLGKVQGAKVEGIEGTGSYASLLAGFLLAWRDKMPFGKDTDFVFPSVSTRDGVEPPTSAFSDSR
jgi:hypothetical protein